MSAISSVSVPLDLGRLSWDESQLEVLHLALINQAGSGGAAFRGLYELHKSLYRHMSFGFIMRRTGISSKGYLSHVMNGDRRMNPRYQASLCEVFKLTGQARAALYLLWQHDEARQRDRRAAELASKFALKAHAGLQKAM